jgi:uncharacterized protein
MHIWIDGDACPKMIKNILFSAATRTKTQLIIVSNHFVNIPPSHFITRKIVASGFDVADNYIVENLQENDLVITADIPLADEVISKKGIALNPRGKLYSAENIKHILATRNMNESLRDCGMIRGGAGKISQKEIQSFSNHLDRILSRAKK